MITLASIIFFDSLNIALWFFIPDLLKIIKFCKNKMKIKKGELVGLEITEKGIIQYVGEFSGIEFYWEDIETVTLNSRYIFLIILLKPNTDYLASAPLTTRLQHFFSSKKMPREIRQSLRIYDLSSQQLENFFRAHIKEKFMII